MATFIGTIKLTWVKSVSPVMCEYCHGKEIINQNNSIIICPFCLRQDTVIRAIQSAVLQARTNDKFEFADDLEAVLEFLPNYPVMAIMEIEAREMNEYLSELISNAFFVLPLK